MRSISDWTAGSTHGARAGNFSDAELDEAVKYLHLRGVRGYVTLNTLMFTSELPEFERIVRRLGLAGVDAVLVQDLGAARLIREICPQLALHASTQMTLTSAECIEEARGLGLERVVLPRELSIEEIRQVRAGTDMELEVFVHGALCVAYSGQCLTSESLGGRSANRGQCAQACRLPWEIVCDGQLRDFGDQKYLLSPQDLAAWSLLPELLEAGVCSFKIEGRLKTPEYVAQSTSHYRQALDAALAGQAQNFHADRCRSWSSRFPAVFHRAGCRAAIIKCWCLPKVPPNAVFCWEWSTVFVAELWQCDWNIPSRPGMGWSLKATEPRERNREDGFIMSQLGESCSLAPWNPALQSSHSNPPPST
ncbi:MAG UNVERIFIED_CONTAM: U32 family peptidase [Planctomycetaceae bacterium]|jgi:putative protease